MKNILIVFTGGTFSMMFDPDAAGVIPKYSGEELLTKIPKASEIAEITCYDFGKYPGPHMTPQLMLELSNCIKEQMQQKNYDGIIVTHGTDTLEETAYFLDLTIDVSIPIVVIGSMKSSSEPDWDGPQNLIDATHICLNENSKDLGVLVCLNGKINAASEVTKIYSHEIDTFQSLDFGPLGFIENSRVIYNRLPKRLETIETDRINPNVELITVYSGMDEKFFKFIVESATKGLVIEALGIGNVPPAAFEGIKQVIDKGIPVVLVSRCPAGPTSYIYSYPGAGVHLRNAGVIFTDYLNGQKARIKLMLALTKTTNIDELRQVFESHERK